MSFKSSHKVHNALRILLHGFSRLKVRKVNDMRKLIRNITRKVTDYLKEIINDELRVMDVFYAQYD